MHATHHSRDAVTPASGHDNSATCHGAPLTSWDPAHSIVVRGKAAGNKTLPAQTCARSQDMKGSAGAYTDRHCICAQFLVTDEAAGAVKALRPVGEVEFVLTPRELPELMALEARLDSSLREPLAALHALGSKCASKTRSQCNLKFSTLASSLMLNTVTVI